MNKSIYEKHSHWSSSFLVKKIVISAGWQKLICICNIIPKEMTIQNWLLVKEDQRFTVMSVVWYSNLATTRFVQFHIFDIARSLIESRLYLSMVLIWRHHHICFSQPHFWRCPTAIFRPTPFFQRTSFKVTSL